MATDVQLTLYTFFVSSIKTFIRRYTFLVSAQKIHISMDTKILLDSAGGYFMEPRGLIVVDVRLFGQMFYDKFYDNNVDSINLNNANYK